jgi:ferric-dicitrate binding protein FerR (iron transport regulator)
MYQQLLGMDGNIIEWVRKLDDGACVQIQNKEYQEWLAKDNTPEPEETT